MKYGIDYDGTIADRDIMKVRWIKKNLDKDIPQYKTNRLDCISLIGFENYQKMCDKLDGKKLTSQFPEVPGAIQAIKQISKIGEIYLVTSRSLCSIEFSKRWLYKKSVLDCFSGFYTTKGIESVEKSKEQICVDFGLDVLIDNDERHLVGMELPNLRRILITNNIYQIHKIHGIECVIDWEELLKLIL